MHVNIYRYFVCVCNYVELRFVMVVALWMLPLQIGWKPLWHMHVRDLFSRFFPTHVPVNVLYSRTMTKGERKIGVLAKIEQAPEYTWTAETADSGSS